MDDVWKKKVEKDVTSLNRRITDVEGTLALDAESMAILREGVIYLKNIAKWAELTYKIVAPVGKFGIRLAKWGSRIALVYAACTWGISWAITHIAAPVVKLITAWRS